MKNTHKIDSSSDNQLANASDENNLVFETPGEILEYGKDATVGISKFADEILSQINLSYTSESSKLLKNLNTLLNRFNKKDFADGDKKNILTNIIRTSKKKISAIHDKYTTFSKQVDKIFIEIKKYELEVNESNELLLEMYDRNMTFYSNLDEYISNARKYLDQELNPRLNKLLELSAKSGSGESQLEAGKLNEIKDILEQRIYDLELAKAVSLQTAPQIKLVQKGNYNLSRKINSAFVITLPLFKQEIIQAITIQRQKVQMDSMNALDESTNKLLKQNAENIVANATRSVEFNRNSAIRLDVLEQSFNTIVNGIKEVEQLEAENREERINSMKRLEQLRQSLISGEAITSD